MVGRSVLDGLRKGKKDLYALNVQYCRRYCNTGLYLASIDLTQPSISPLAPGSHLADVTLAVSSSNEMTKSWHFVCNKMSASMPGRRQQSTSTEREPRLRRRAFLSWNRTLTWTRMKR